MKKLILAILGGFKKIPQISEEQLKTTFREHFHKNLEKWKGYDFPEERMEEMIEGLVQDSLKYA